MTRRPRRGPRRGRWAWAAVGALLLIGCQAGPSPRSQAVAYEASDQHTGRPVSLASLRGSPVLLASWATWCAPCRIELPKLQALHERRRGDGLRIVLVNVDSDGADRSAIDSMAERYGLTMPLWRDPTDRFATTFGGLGVPATVLVDRGGRVVDRWFGTLRTSDPDVVGSLDRVTAAARPAEPPR